MANSFPTSFYSPQASTRCTFLYVQLITPIGVECSPFLSPIRKIATYSISKTFAMTALIQVGQFMNKHIL